MKTGKFIVLDGADGCGKATQTQLLTNKLIALGHPSETIDFPQYENNILGRLIGQCQKSTDYVFAEMDPRIASMLYAIDRFESKPMLEAWLTGGKHIIADRYISANQLHQGGKIEDIEERQKFLQFLDTVEYGIFKLPRPDMTILLDVPHAISLKLMKEKNAGDKKLYSQGEMDQVEQHLQYQLGARDSGVTMLQDETWVKIQCSLDGETLRSREDIHEEILQHALRLIV